MVCRYSRLWMRFLCSSLQSVRLLFPDDIQMHGIEPRRGRDSTQQTALNAWHAYLGGFVGGIQLSLNAYMYFLACCAKARYVRCFLLPAVEEISRVYFSLRR